MLAHGGVAGVGKTQLLKADGSLPFGFGIERAVREEPLDEHTFDERDPGLISVDPLGFTDQKPYPDRLAAAQLATGLKDAAEINGRYANGQGLLRNGTSINNLMAGDASKAILTMSMLCLHCQLLRHHLSSNFRCSLCLPTP